MNGGKQALAAVLAIALGAGCTPRRATPGHWVKCTCPYLTDYDDRASHKVEVCVAPGQQPASAAAACVALHQPGHVDPCSCQPEGSPCDGSQACRSLETQP